MKLNDDNLMIFDLENLDFAYGGVDNENFAPQYAEFDCDLDLSTPIKTTLIEEIDLLNTDTDFTSDLSEFTDSLFTNSLNNSSDLSNNLLSDLSNNLLSDLSNNLLSDQLDFIPNTFNGSSLNQPFNTTNSFMGGGESKPVETNNQDKRDVRKKLLDLTQRKLNNTLCYDNKLRNHVLLKSALKKVNTMDEEHLLGIKNVDRQENCDELKQDKPNASRQLKPLNKCEKDEMYNEQDALSNLNSPSRKRNFKSNSSSQSNEKDILEEKNKIKKQKLSHQLDDENEEEFIDENNFNYNDELALNNLANCFIRLKTQQPHD